MTTGPNRDNPGERGSFDAQIREHLRESPRPAPRIDPATLARTHEARSADGNVTATIDGQTLAIASVVIGRITDRNATEAAVVEAVNAALSAAESGGVAGMDLEQAIADRVAALDRAMDRMTERLDDLGSRLDTISSSIDTQRPRRT